MPASSSTSWICSTWSTAHSGSSMACLSSEGVSRAYFPIMLMGIGYGATVTIWYGGDYNPEQWPQEVWAEDMKLMTDCGVSLVSVGIFAWASVEPRPGVFEFGWFDRVMEHLAGAGVGVSLATMTASPPAWLSTAYPEMLPETAEGTRLWHGSRQHYCPSSPVYREHAARLVE